MIWNRIVKWFRNMSERRELLREWNDNARKAYVEGEIPLLLEASISMGNGGFKHEMSAWLRTGFRIQSRKLLVKEDMLGIGQVILLNRELVRQLIILGFDTLEIYDEGTRKGVQWVLKDFRDLQLNR